MSSFEGGSQDPGVRWDRQASLDTHCLKKVTGEGGEGGSYRSMECRVRYLGALAYCIRSPSLGGANCRLRP